MRKRKERNCIHNTQTKPRTSPFPAFSQKLAVDWELGAAAWLPGNRLPLVLLTQEPPCSDVRGRRTVHARTMGSLPPQTFALVRHVGCSSQDQLAQDLGSKANRRVRTIVHVNPVWVWCGLVSPCCSPRASPVCQVQLWGDRGSTTAHARAVMDGQHCVTGFCKEHNTRSKKGIGSPGTGVMDSYEPSCGSWEPNPGPLKGQ